MAAPVVRFPIVALIRVVGGAIAAMVIIWAVHFRGGMALIADNKDLIFNGLFLAIALVIDVTSGRVGILRCVISRFLGVWPTVWWKLWESQGTQQVNIAVGHLSLNTVVDKVHPVLMVVGFILLNGEAILAYKTVSGTKNFKKLVHLTVQFLALCLGLIGIWAALKFHNDKGIDNFYSLHSWLGLACILLFGIQWGTGFATFWYPGGSRNGRAVLLPWHVFFGVYIYALAVATAVTGLLEKATFLQSSNIISRYSNEALLVNFLGISLVMLGGIVILAVVSPGSGKGDAYRGITE